MSIKASKAPTSPIKYLGERGYGDFDAVQKKALALKPDLASRASSAKMVYDRILSEKLKPAETGF